MKWNVLFVLSVIALPMLSEAQLGGLMNKVKSKVNQRIDNKVDRAIDNTLDKAEGKPAAPVATADTETSEETPKKEAASVKSYSKFDFVPGERILYTEDFAQDVIGELPVNWNSSGKGEVMTIENREGKWLRLFQGNTYLTGNKKTFGENYTIEFDLIFYFQPKVTGYILPEWKVGIFSSGEKDNTENEFLGDRKSDNGVDVELSPSSNAGARLHSYQDHRGTFHSERVPLDGYMSSINKPLHYSIQVQKQRFRMWINETKVFDIPRAVNTRDTLNQIYFYVGGSNYKDDEIGAFLTNIKVATGLPDTRHKLIEEGKFSTTGILFDFQSAVIKQESYGVIKEIASVLKENPSVKIKVVGHTSSDGDDAANLELSKKRAAAVKEILEKEYSIDASRLQAEGKGETQPVADNKTKEGKVQNRRVEFIKL